MKTREDIITSMCYTMRHDYGLLDEQNRNAIYRQAAQLFDNDIAPHMEFKKEWKERLVDKLNNTVRWERDSAGDFIGVYNTVLNYPLVSEDYGQFTGGIVSKTYDVGLFYYQCIWWDENKYPNEIIRTRVEDAN